eukprot:scaffold104281_cov65-Phaeocystis_antarctica.AAC.2
MARWCAGTHGLAGTLGTQRARTFDTRAAQARRVGQLWVAEKRKPEWLVSPALRLFSERHGATHAEIDGEVWRDRKPPFVTCAYSASWIARKPPFSSSAQT